MNDIRGQLDAYRDLGALGPDADFDTIIRELRLDQPVIDPTTLNSEELTKELQRVTKALLGYGAKLPKPLMLFVKNMLFIDDATSHLAPDQNLFEEVARIYAYFADKHSDRIAAEAGINPAQTELDLTGYKAALGVSADTEHLSHRDLQGRREVIRTRLEGRAK
jgi:ubiquinone biosynthesis protein